MGNNKLVFASACFGILIFGMSLVTLGSVAPNLSQEYHLDKISSGALFSILPIGILVGSIIFGPIADRYGYKIILVLAGLVIFAGFQGIAYSGSLNVLRICVFLFGVSGGTLNGGANALVSDISDKNKSANLSLLGVFFAVGALGMPFVLGTLQSSFSFKQIVSGVGMIPLLATLIFLLTRFPEPKQKQKLPIREIKTLFRSDIILLVGFFLFCQSSYEGIINNWTTTYLTQKLSFQESKALYTLSLYVAGMAVMRIFIGGIFRNISSPRIMRLSFALLLAGCFLLWWSAAHWVAITGLIFLGAGLAAGFPVMLGIIGDSFAELSGTAFSIVLTIALLGNMIVNFLMGVIAQKYGILHLTTVAFVLTVVMIILFTLIKQKSNLHNK